MSTIMTSADGKRRCDGTCHSAKHAKCACICGGKFHGAAVLPEKSAERTELEKLILDKDAHRVVADALLADSPDQPLLFGAPDAKSEQQKNQRLTDAKREQLRRESR